MSNIDWLSLSEKHKNGSLKEHFQSTFLNSANAKDAYLLHCKYFLSEYKIDSVIITDLPVFVQILKQYLVSIPSFLLQDLTVPISLLEWLQNIVNTSQNAALRGSAVSIMGLLIKSIPSVSNLGETPMNVFSTGLRQTVKLLAEGDEANILGAVMLIHQLEELLNALGNGGVTMQIGQISSSIVDVAAVLSQLTAASSQVQGSVSRLQVDAAKLCAMLCELWVGGQRAQSQDSTLAFTSLDATVCGIARSLLTVAKDGEVVHDCFHSAFHGAAQLMHALKTHASVDAAVRHAAVDAWSECHADCAEYVSSGGDLLSVFGCGRLETIVGFLSCFYEASAPASQSGSGSEEYSEALVDSAVQSLVSLQGRMRSAVQQHGAGAAAEDSRQLKSLYSDIRKGAIACATSLLAVSPQWIAAHPLVFWDLCLKSLATPVLFPCGVRALPADAAFAGRVLAFVDSALRGVAKYSVAAADDIVLTLQDLVDTCAEDCPQLFATVTDRVSVPRSLLAGLHLSPKAAPGSSSASVRLNWQVAVVATLNSLVQQSSKLVAQGRLDCALSASYLSDLVLQLSAEFTALSPSGASDDEDGKKKRRGGRNADLAAELLQHVTIALISAAELYRSLVGAVGSENHIELEACLLGLAAHLMRGVCRPVLFEDDRVQVCTEADLLGRITVALSGSHRELVPLSVVALCNMLYGRNASDAHLVVELSPFYRLVEQLQQQSEGNAAEAKTAFHTAADAVVQQLYEELRCAHASSLSESAQSSLAVVGDVQYEAAREALLSIAHHCADSRQSGGSEKSPEAVAPAAAAAESARSSYLQAVYDALPLRLDSQSAPLAVKASLVYDILSNIRVLSGR